MTDLCNKRILITGGAGFLGRHVVRTLEERGCKKIVVPRRSQYDLTQEEAVARLYHEAQPAVVIHLAASVGDSIRAMSRVISSSRGLVRVCADPRKRSRYPTPGHAGDGYESA